MSVLGLTSLPSCQRSAAERGVAILLPQPDATWTLESSEVTSLKKAAAGF
jgi:hypothetical protein